jgi:hypothetical protein
MEVFDRISRAGSLYKAPESAFSLSDAPLQIQATAPAASARASLVAQGDIIEQLTRFAQRTRPDGVFFGGKISGVGTVELTFAIEENGSLRRTGVYHSVPGESPIPGIGVSQVGHNGVPAPNQRGATSTTGMGISVDAIPGRLSTFVNAQGDLHPNTDGRLGTFNFGIVINPDKFLADGLVAWGSATGGISAAIGGILQASPLSLSAGISYAVAVYLNPDGTLRIDHKGEPLPGFQHVEVPDGVSAQQFVQQLVVQLTAMRVSAEEELAVMAAAAAHGQRDPGIDPWVIAEASNPSDIVHVPALNIAVRIRRAIHDIGPKYEGQLTDYSQGIVTRGGPRSTDDAAYVLDEIWRVANANDRKLLERMVSNSYGMDFDLPWFQQANEEHAARNYAERPTAQEILDVEEYFAPIELEVLVVPQGNMKDSGSEPRKDAESRNN